MNYYPLQIPDLLDSALSQYINYSEEVLDEFTDFIICYWQILPKDNTKITVDNIIIIDGCIDLVVDFDKKIIGFSGTRKTDFHFPLSLPRRFMGLRFLPGVFYQLTGLNPIMAIDNLVALGDVYPTFAIDDFFELTFDEAKQTLIGFITRKLTNIVPNIYTQLFNKLIVDPPASVKELCQLLNISQSQCQRNFKKYYGLTPKTVLTIVRFQSSLKVITTREVPKFDDETTLYYDQSHFINDYKRHIGITPLELFNRYQR